MNKWTGLNKWTLATLLATTMLPTVALAQTERLPGVVDKPLSERVDDILKSYSVDRKPGAPLEPAPTVEQVQGNEVVGTLRAVNFTGATVVDQSELQAVAARYLGRPLTKKDVAQLKYELTRVFYDKGYILVKVNTPPQDLSDGVLNVEVFEARVGSVNVNDNGVIRPFVAQQIARRVASDEIFQEKTVESMVSDMNDLGNVQATVSLKPGQRFGTTDLDVSVTGNREDQQVVSIDNYGSELTGEYVASAHLEYSNPFGAGETFSADLRHSNEELWSVRGGLDTPIGFRNVHLETSYLHSENEIGDRLSALNASGKTDAVNVALSSKLLNTRTNTATARVGFEARTHKSFISDVTDTKDDIRQVYAETSYLHRNDLAVMYGDLRLTKGIDVFGTNRRNDPLATRAAGDPEAFKVEPTVLLNLRPTEDDSVKLYSTGQLSTNTLLSSDLFILGGYGSVRGFEPAEETGEGGYSFSLQYDRDLHLHPDWQLRAGPFLDGGTVWNRIDGVTSDAHLYSAGLGVEAVTSFVPTGDTKLRLDWAHPLRNIDSPNVDDDSFYFRVSQAF